MSKWYRIDLPLRFPSEAEKVSAFLIDLGIESIEETDSQLFAWISEDGYSLKKSIVEEWLTDYYGAEFNLRWQEVQQQNWNEEWERNYPAVGVDHIIRVRAPFHEHDPSFLHEIVIEPAMAFGTGHHETTSMMLSMIFGLQIHGRRVCDVGCGSGVLGIFSGMQGGIVQAFDNDPVAVENARHNFQLNGVRPERIFTGIFVPHDLAPLDLILANINRNTLLELIPLFAASQSSGGEILLSGFYQQDEQLLLKSASENGYNLIRKKSLNDWSCLHLGRL